jgi:hypothetical protein
MPKSKNVIIGKEKGLVGGNSLLSPLSLPDGTKYRSDKISIATYRKMRDNYQISACLNVIAFMLQKLDWYIDADESTDEVKKVVETSIGNIWTQLMRGITKAVWSGYSPMTKVFSLDGKYIVLKKIRDLAPETCNIKTDKKGNFDGFFQYKGQQTEEEIDPKYAFWYAFQMEDGDLYGNSMLKSAYKPWYYQELVHLFANRYYERFGEPVVKGTAPNETIEDKDGTKRDAMATIQTLGESLKSNSVITIPSETDEKGNLLYDIKYLESQMRGVDFDTYLKRLDMEMARAIFIPDLMFGSGRVGSYELGREQKATFITGLMGIADDIFGYIQNYIVRQIVDLNFGETSVAPKIKYMPLSIVNQDTYATIVQSLINRGRVFPDIKALGEKMGLTLEEIHEQAVANPFTPDGNPGEPNKPVKSNTPKKETAKKQLGRIERYLTNVFRNSRNPETIEEALDGIKIGYREEYTEGYEEMEKMVKRTIKDGYENNYNLEEIISEVSSDLGLSNTISKLEKQDNILKVQVQTVSDDLINSMNEKLNKSTKVQEELLEESKKDKSVTVSNDLEVKVKNPVTKVEVSNIKDAKSDSSPIIVKEDKIEKPDSIETIKTNGKVVEIIEKYGDKEVRHKVNKTLGGSKIMKE